MANKLTGTKTSTKLIILFVTIAILWILSGVVTGKGKKPEEAPEKLVSSVRVIESVAKDNIDNITVNGVTKASRIVELKAETVGKVTQIIATEGADLKANTPLIKLDYRDRMERLNQAKALVNQKQTELAANEKLFAKGLQSEVRVSAAKSDYEMAKAQLKDAELEVDHVTIKAPFDGRFEKSYVEVGDVVQAGQEVGRFIDNDPFLVVAQINENQIGSVTIGKEAECKTVSGGEYKGKVSYISSVADVKTRTFNIEVEIPNKDKNLFDGMTTQVIIPTSSIKAHLISPAFFSLSEAGIIGVKTVDDKNIVHFNKIEIVSDGPDGNWVTGLPDKANIISTGQEFVKDGEHVQVTKESLYKK